MVPSIGHLEGVIGILTDPSPTGRWILIEGTASYGTAAFAFFFCYDGLMSGCWAFLRQFRDEHPEGGIPLTPDAEKEARAKFIPSNDQPDKRNIKPGDR